jgi:uncharacterized membrane protein YhaH (DUF805 family)
MALDVKVCYQCGEPILRPKQKFCGLCGIQLNSGFNNSSAMVGFVQAIQLGFRHYFDFRGRSTRSEFWWWTLFTIITATALIVLVDLPLGTYDRETNSGLISGIFRTAVLIPSLAVGARRLHDINRSGWWLLMWLVFWLIVPLVILIVWHCKKGDIRNNTMDL